MSSPILKNIFESNIFDRFLKGVKISTKMANKILSHKSRWEKLCNTEMIYNELNRAVPLKDADAAADKKEDADKSCAEAAKGKKSLAAPPVVEAS